MPPASSAGSGSAPTFEALWTAAAVTLLVTAASTAAPPAWIASLVGATFLGATWLTVFRRDDAAVRHSGLAFGGLIFPEPIDVRRVVKEGGRALGWALVMAAVVFVPFYVGFRLYARVVWHATPVPWHAVHVSLTANEVFGQLGLVALPEEVFYRGYLQTRLDDAWPPRWRVAGATIGPALLVTSAIFALGHLLTIHDVGRLAVFFPSLLFGWLRARTGGVGASVLFHASCNLYSATLLQAYGPHP
jgi:membrane protease YdiL (CAAX protease family)